MIDVAEGSNLFVWDGIRRRCERIELPEPAARWVGIVDADIGPLKGAGERLGRVEVDVISGASLVRLDGAEERDRVALVPVAEGEDAVVLSAVLVGVAE